MNPKELTSEQKQEVLKYVYEMLSFYAKMTPYNSYVGICIIKNDKYRKMFGPEVNTSFIKFPELDNWISEVGHNLYPKYNDKGFWRKLLPDGIFRYITVKEKLELFINKFGEFD